MNNVSTIAVAASEADFADEPGGSIHVRFLSSQQIFKQTMDRRGRVRLWLRGREIHPRKSKGWRRHVRRMKALGDRRAGFQPASSRGRIEALP